MADPRATVDDFERMWADLAPVGRSAATGGYLRQPWTSAELELRAWFAEQAAARGLVVETDAVGNTVGWWGTGTGPGVLTGSHLDSVVDGGAYDGPLGVVSALAAVDRLRERGVVPSRPLGVGVFVEEEGSRFGLACLGSRLATGSVTWADVEGLTDRDGVRLGDVVEGGSSSLLEGVGCFVELHVEQGRALVDLDAPVGVASGIWPHGRWRFDFAGTADHAGTTRMEDRADPVLTFSMTALAANKQARLAAPDARATFGRVEVAPNGTNAIPSRVSAWLDARCSSEPALTALVAAVTEHAVARAERDGTSVTVTAESVSGAVSFERPLVDPVAGRRRWPVLPTQAGHDAGALSAAGIPSAMLFVRNPTGVSHSPAEHAEIADCLAGVEALADVLEESLR
ncbi:allantoate amidohydrolase [Nocardioides sp. IC4_145]|uniref:allantoate amidohydrolase n=1 Tax=Nocardioides sp. IC4_145 TaxID=2714037 RepID=UPI00325C1CA7